MFNKLFFWYNIAKKEFVSMLSKINSHSFNLVYVCRRFELVFQILNSLQILEFVNLASQAFLLRISKFEYCFYNNELHVEGLSCNFLDFIGKK